MTGADVVLLALYLAGAAYVGVVSFRNLRAETGLSYPLLALCLVLLLTAAWPAVLVVLLLKRLVRRAS